MVLVRAAAACALRTCMNACVYVFAHSLDVQGSRTFMQSMHPPVGPCMRTSTHTFHVALPLNQINVRQGKNGAVTILGCRTLTLPVVKLVSNYNYGHTILNISVCVVSQPIHRSMQL